jgi:hypothetical protein
MHSKLAHNKGVPIGHPLARGQGLLFGKQLPSGHSFKLAGQIFKETDLSSFWQSVKTLTTQSPFGHLFGL